MIALLIDAGAEVIEFEDVVVVAHEKLGSGGAPLRVAAVRLGIDEREEG